HGHLAGNEALRRLGALVHRRVRGHDLASRFGGEEFLIALPGTDAAGARELAESLREAVAAMAIDWHGRTLGITVSAGVHAVVPEEGDRLD
ncbi:MAG TPA: GGDEF domain-containing protein, partial [Usitatibacteraceae bacterium]|nr:GGDEF domain-containing protein [Usitatibacteraceae bacterium]